MTWRCLRWNPVFRPQRFIGGLFKKDGTMLGDPCLPVEIGLPVSAGKSAGATRQSRAEGAETSCMSGEVIITGEQGL